MKFQKVIGLFIIAMSILTISLQRSLANLARYVDQTTGKYWSDAYAYKYMPINSQVFFWICLAIGIYLIVKKD
ncbi:hypothetical protein [Tepidibacter hydrothermalis]|uniref:Uncharacterized protein n=1 Tax=Tepidibacter hydrothermalis TaxID=3036126 RepID=A0ABY8ECX5_9FIRM|nr:hypothetical protein [Tepidibacter hydrothermalis]WFD10790.1 hypothetical protein P4S50_01555 [Tepidibacter hydrothermalis]